MLSYLRPNYYIAINSALDITMLIRQTLITYSVILICNFLHNIHIYYAYYYYLCCNYYLIVLMYYYYYVICYTVSNFVVVEINGLIFGL